MTITRIIKRWLFRKLFNMKRRARLRSMKSAVDEAKRITQETGKKVLIYLIDGEYKCITKQELKRRRLGHLENKCEIKIESYATRKNVNVGH